MAALTTVGNEEFDDTDYLGMIVALSVFVLIILWSYCISHLSGIVLHIASSEINIFLEELMGELIGLKQSDDMNDYAAKYFKKWVKFPCLVLSYYWLL